MKYIDCRFEGPEGSPDRKPVWCEAVKTKEDVLAALVEVGVEITRQADPNYWSFEDHYRAASYAKQAEALRNLYRRVRFELGHGGERAVGNVLRAWASSKASMCSNSLHILADRCDVLFGGAK